MNKCLAFLAILIFSAAETQAGESWYGSARVGTGIVLDAELDDPTGVLAALATELTFDPGVGLSGSVGYAWNKFRLEGEIAYDINDFDELEIFGVGAPASGDVESLSFMVNAWRDFHLTDPWSVYGGGGLGFTVISADDGGFVVDDSDEVFAYQVGLGLGYAINRDMILTVDYRFFGTAEPDFISAGGVPFSSEYYLHRFGIGVRMNF